MLIIDIIVFSVCFLMFSVSMFNLGKRSYKVNLNVDVEEIIQKEIKKFLDENSSKECNHKWELLREYNISNDGINKEKVFIQQCKHCGELTEKRVKAAG